jgi:hypothetical protein
MTRSLAVALVLVTLSASAWAGTTRYNPRRSGHPLRVIAYALHPFGVIVDTLVFRPAWWVGTHEPFRTLFGVEVVIDDSAEVAREIEARRQLEAPPPVEPPPPTEPDAPEPLPD